MNFAEKYDPHNAGVTYIFDKFYSIIGGKPLHGNMLATPGENLERYLKYAKIVCFSTKGKAIFVENFRPRYERLKEQLAKENKHIRSKIRIMFANAECYEMYPNMPKKVRLEDLGIGLGTAYMLRMGTYRLMKQVLSTTTGSSNSMWKAHILDSAFRQISQPKIVALYQGYVSCVPGLQIKRINGFAIGTDSKPFNSCNAEEVLSYRAKNKRRCKVYKHNVELESRRRKAELHIYTCINGSRMMSSLLMYK